MTDDYKVRVSEYGMKSDLNEWLHQYNETQINLPDVEAMWPDMAALAWHREYVFAG